MATPPPRRSAADVTLSAFDPPLRDALLPLLLYKSVFLGDWFEAMVRQERDDALRQALLAIGKDTFHEAIEAIDTFRPWQSVPFDADRAEALVHTLRRHLLHDLLHLKEGNNEAMLYVAMHAPTDELRRKLVRLADRDREHANVLRGLLGAELPDQEDVEKDGAALGAREGRAGTGTLARSLRDDLARLKAGGSTVHRIVVSPAALRHLRDEASVASDGTVLGIPVDVDFGWSGECHAFETDERVRLSEMLSQELRDAPHA